jgi:hypothetical protein
VARTRWSPIAAVVAATSVATLGRDALSVVAQELIAEPIRFASGVPA